jgi:DNA-binding XRE family transcriptional regulator
MPRKRVLLARARKAAGLTQEELSYRLGVDRSTVGRWELGETEPQPWLRPKLARVLGLSRIKLEELLAPSEPGGTDASERVGFALAHPASTDLVTVAQLREQICDLDDRYVTEPSTALLADAGQRLGHVRFLATRVTSGRVRRELAAAEAEAAILMGQLVWDASQRRDHGTAHRYLDQAVSAARECGDIVSEGLALLRRTIVVLYGEQAPVRALDLALQTAATTRGVSNVLTGLALLHAAEAHAMLGADLACEGVLAEAATCFSAIDQSDGASDLFSSSQFGRMAGSCYLALKDHARAQTLLEEAASALSDQSKSHTIVLGNLALAAIGQRNLDEAATRLHQTIDAIEVNWSGGGLNIVFSASRELAPWRDLPAVQDVQDRLLSLVAAT